MTRATASRWRGDGKLHPVFPGVDALGHPFVPIEGRLVAALLYAGDGFVLSHATAAWWWGLLCQEPTVIELSGPRRVRPTGNVVAHQRRTVEQTRHRRFPVTTLAQTLLDVAAQAELLVVRLALAEADYQRLLDAAAIVAITGQGKPGSIRLREALKRHQPQLARARSPLEVAFFLLCEAAGLPLPELNVRIHGWKVDALWRRERLVVEIDGHRNHRSQAQIDRDRRKELTLRAAGFLVLRYSSLQVLHDPELVKADVAAQLLERAALAA